MKTALQELIEKLQELEDNVPYAMEREATRYCKILANDYLEKEKQQIIESHNKGQQYYNPGYNPDISEQYYNETYKNNP